MKWIDDLKTGMKLFGGFGIVIVLMLVIAVLGYMGMNTMDNGMTSMYFDRLVPIEQVSRMSIDLYMIRGDVYKALLIPEEKAASEASIPALVEDFNNNFDLYKASPLLTDVEKTEVSIIEPAWVEYQAAVQEIIDLDSAGKQQEVFKSMVSGGRASIARTALSDAVDKLIAENKKVAEETNTAGDVTFASSRNLLIGVGLFGILLAIAFGTVITRSITIPLNIVVNISKAMAIGDLVI
ncbi:MAG: MCP four helix bundle domain-containing protein [Actinobacteria bacterium]|nr:MCP four helix bundle domain-containing protein [Actinomycetota bacterium]